MDGENLYLSTGGNAIVKYYNGKAAYSTDTYCLTTKANTKCYYLNLMLNFMIETINANYFKGAGLKHLQKQDLKQIKVPIPPPKVQQQIVDKCERVDNEAEQAHQTIATAQQQIKRIMQNAPKPKTLGEVVQSITDVINPEKQSGSVNFIGLENIEPTSGRLVGNIETDFATVKSIKNVFQKGDVLYGKLRPNLNKVYIAQHNGICSTDILVFRLRNPDNAIFYKHYFLSSEFNSAVLKTVSGQQLPRTSWTKIVKIPAPPLDIQRKLVAAVAKLDTTIAKYQAVINHSIARKNTILNKYL